MPSGRFDHKKGPPLAQQKQDQEQEQEQDQQQERKQDQEQQQNKAHNTVGNAALAAMISGRGAAGMGTEGGGGGGGHSVRKRKVADKEGEEFGGDDVVDDVPISLDDLTRSWNPRIKKTDDRPLFVEPMPDDDLPPEDPEFLAAVDAMPSSGPLPRISTIDALLQPSIAVVARSMRDWARATTRWAAPTPGWRTTTWMASHTTPILQVADARVLPARAAVGAIGSCVLAASPTVLAAPTIETGALIEFCLELSGRSHRVDNLLAELADQASKLPKAYDLLETRLPEGGAPVRPIALPDAARDPLLDTLHELSRWLGLEDQLPTLPESPEPEPDPDDPLGLDAIIVAETGGPEDRDAGVYNAALQIAERLAAEASRTRIHWVAVALLVDDVASAWSASTGPVMLTLAGELDTQVNKVLQLLLEVARACQKRSFPPRALRNGLLRAARQIDTLRRQLLDLLSRVIGAVLPGAPDFPPLRAIRPDPLQEALSAGAPLDALPWVASLPAGLDTEIARLALISAAGLPSDEIVAVAESARPPGPRTADPLAAVGTILLAHARLRQEETSAVHELAAELRAVGRARRNGLLVAEGALLSMEAHVLDDQLEAAQTVRLSAGRLCKDLDAHAGLSLLARWTPPAEEDEDFAPFFDYPMEVDDDEDEDEATA